jgi:hypothetical protein
MDTHVIYISNKAKLGGEKGEIKEFTFNIF